MFLTQQHLSRRTMLRGLGVTVALPFLDAMIPAGTAFAQSRKQPVRLIAMEMVHGSAGSTAFGIKKNMWAPAATGSDFDLSPSSLKPLEAYRDYLTIVSRSACCNDCGGTLRTGGECVFRFEPKEILCIVCADLRNLKYRPSLRWEKAARKRAKGLERRT